MHIILRRCLSLLFLGLLSICLGSWLPHFEAFNVNIVFDAKLLDNRTKNVFHVRVIAVVSVHASARALLLFKRLLNRIDLVEPVELVDNLTQKDKLIEELQIKANKKKEGIF